MTVVVVIIVMVIVIYGWSKQIRNKRVRRGTYRPPVRPGSPLLTGGRRPQIPYWMKQEVYVRDGGRCQHCGITEQELRIRSGHPMEYDHITPYSWGGPTRADNLQLLCPNCNTLKSNRYAG